MPNALVEVLREKLTIPATTPSSPAVVIIILKTLLFPQCRQSQSGEQTTATFTPHWFDKAQFRNGFDAIRERDVCSIILIIPLSMYWNCCVRLRRPKRTGD